MKLSVDWLKEYIDIGGITPDKLANKLTMATAEVDDLEKITRAVKGVYVCTVLSVEPMETGDPAKTINYVKVSCGKDTFETVCGAPNVKVGMKSALAVPGTEISEGFVVKEQKVYGRTSKGMLCSPKELGWGESHAGIMAFHDSLVDGIELAELVPEVDHIIEIDNKSITHRPDLWGHYGFAREIAAVFDLELKPLNTADSSKWANLGTFPVEIRDLNGCPGYCCLDIDGLTQSFSVMEMQYRLLAIGLRPINLLVDLTNFIMCELGQPMHAFDGERVRDVIVDSFGKKGTFKTLDSISREMLPEDLMIFDHTGPIAIAGIMGGEESEIKENTSRLLLESANFHPARIRRTALRLGLRTDASLRFEKGQPPVNMAISIKRLVKLLEEAGQKPVIKSALSHDGEMGEKPRYISMKADYIKRTIGMDVPEQKIRDILGSIGFGCKAENNSLSIEIPPFRSSRDISIPNDIVEEVARIYGYDNIEPTMPEVEMRQYTFNGELQKQHKIRKFLSMSKGFNEVHTYSWYDEVWIKKIGYSPENVFTLLNPSSENNVRMRKDLIPNLLALVEPNSVYRDSFFVYEVGNVSIEEKGERVQYKNIGCVGYQSDKIGSLQDLFLKMKGALEEIFVVTNAAKPVFETVSSCGKPWEISGSFMDVAVSGTKIGRMGYLAGDILAKFEKGTQVVWFEINLDKLEGLAYPELKFSELPVYPGSWMDFTVLAEKALTYRDIENEINGFSHPVFKQWKYLYLYAGKGLPEGKISYTFRFWLGLKERTLTGDDINDFRNSFLEFLSQKGFTLR